MTYSNGSSVWEVQSTCEDGWRDERRPRVVTADHASLALQAARTRHARAEAHQEAALCS